MQDCSGIQVGSHKYRMPGLGQAMPRKG